MIKLTINLRCLIYTYLTYSELHMTNSKLSKSDRKILKSHTRGLLRDSDRILLFSQGGRAAKRDTYKQNQLLPGQEINLNMNKMPGPKSLDFVISLASQISIDINQEEFKKTEFD